jgi:DNA-binding MarR family transcriptional regulator
MSASRPDRPDRPDRPALGPALRRAWIGYQQRVDAAMTDAGFDDRRFPETRILRLCPEGADMTIAQISRELGITRQGAAKIVAELRDRGYVALTPSPADGREKIVTVTAKATAFLDAQQRAARRIEQQLARRLGPDAIDRLYELLEVLGDGDDPRLRSYLRTMRERGV